ncbi:hypothetical protein EJ05DRAFT_499518 [Pseudovirgaria hyperparasitica]|uniref:Zn(2)-C6 fungal-type domain-containing protein n=1 Tax=Pseudovirgaria hyperparasitica TaxID=470096 RepID=A0A6A6WAN3_9PEZI|nr:uncharacterized protein EJ05DRAFT_499518 [Pseudovirgaria hyperparasitica]KAF2759094.1 hypothetical protein EJ05DRAFT_499518 [Pseudovirgaria hyperparasitica]
MAGVPSGRACEACRKQRRKCDQQQPSCSRCKRLKITCVGAGVRRYLFKSYDASNEACKASKQEHTSPERRDRLRIAPSPGNHRSMVVAAFVRGLQVVDLRFDLSWAHGPFLHDVPKRLGQSRVLDTAAMALIANFSNSSPIQAKQCPRATYIFDRAVKALRLGLSNQREARSINTLCAIYLLCIVQNWIGLSDEAGFQGHGEGVAQILNSGIDYNPMDDFERNIIATLCSAVILERFRNPKIRIVTSSHPWISWNKSIGLQCCQDDSSPPAVSEDERHGTPQELLRLLTKAPDFFWADGLRKDARTFYEDILLVIKKFRQCIDENIPVPPLRSDGKETKFFKIEELSDAARIECHNKRRYSFALGLGLMFNAYLRTNKMQDTTLTAQARYFTMELLNIAERAAQYRPLGAGYMITHLLAAWTVETDYVLKLDIERILALYRVNLAQRHFRNVSLEVEQDSWTRLRSLSSADAMFTPLGVDILTFGRPPGGTKTVALLNRFSPLPAMIASV